MGDSKLLELSSDRLSLSHSDGNSLADEEGERENGGGGGSGERRKWKDPKRRGKRQMKSQIRSRRH